jgi:hypothetical protein
MTIEPQRNWNTYPLTDIEAARTKLALDILNNEELDAFDADTEELGEVPDPYDYVKRGDPE